MLPHYLPFGRKKKNVFICDKSRIFFPHPSHMIKIDKLKNSLYSSTVTLHEYNKIINIIVVLNVRKVIVCNALNHSLSMEKTISAHT